MNAMTKQGVVCLSMSRVQAECLLKLLRHLGATFAEEEAEVVTEEEWRVLEPLRAVLEGK